MKNPRPSARPGFIPKPKPPSAAAGGGGPPPRRPPPSASGASGASTSASTAPPSQKPPPATASPKSNKTKSRWESPSKHKPSPKQGGPASASPSTGAIRRDQKVGTAAAPPFPPHGPPPVPLPDPAAIPLPPPPPPYGFQNLDRRTIVLVDGSVRSYFALPPDEPLPDPFGPDRHFPPRPPFPPHLNQFSPEELHEPPFGHRPPGYFPPFDGPSNGKRKYGEEEELARQRMHVLQYGNPTVNPNLLPLGERDRHLGRDERDDSRASKHARIGGDSYDDLRGNRSSRPDDVDRRAVKKAFFKFVKMIYEDADLKKRYLDTGRNAQPLHCIACGRASKDYLDLHDIIMHSHSFSHSPDLRVDHLGFHKALCVLMGWNYNKAPENNKAYQRLSPEEAQGNKNDLILWPPCVIVHNTNFGRRTGGRTEGFGNKEMDNILRDLGFPGGKARSIYDREGHTGVTIVQFAKTESGLKEAERLVNYFERQNHDREGWAHVQTTRSSGDDDRNPLLVQRDDRTGEKKRIFYGYMATISDIDEVDIDTKKRASVESRREFGLSE